MVRERYAKRGASLGLKAYCRTILLIAPVESLVSLIDEHFVADCKTYCKVESYLGSLVLDIGEEALLSVRWKLIRQCCR